MFTRRSVERLYLTQHRRTTMESFWLCDDCLFAAAYEDYSALSLYDTPDEVEKRLAAIQSGLMHLMPISADFDAEAGWGIKPFPRCPVMVVVRPNRVNATNSLGCKRRNIG
jgi:hypothetical protein